MTNYNESLIDKIAEYRQVLCSRIHVKSERCIYHDTVNGCIHIIRQHQAAQGDLVENLKLALERVTANFRLMIAGKPVRDVTETLAECDAAIAAMSMGDVNDKHVVGMPEAIEKHDIHSEISVVDESCPACGFAKSRSVNSMLKCYACGCQWYPHTRTTKPVAAGEISDTDGEMAKGALEAIHALLDDGGIPRGTFADDHVRNLVVLYNQRGDRIAELETTRKPVATDENRDNEDNIGYLIVATIANNIDQHTWEDEWRSFYKPEAWLGSHRAAASFLTDKMRKRKPVSGTFDYEALIDRIEIWNGDNANMLKSSAIELVREYAGYANAK